MGIISGTNYVSQYSGDAIDAALTAATNAKAVDGVLEGAGDGTFSAKNVDASPTMGSDALVESGGVYSAIAGKQDALTFDNAPVENSVNPVKSGGIYNSVEELRGLIYDLMPRKTLPSAPLHAFADGADGIPIKAMSVAVRAVQDLHGQTSPYPAGGGKNKLGVTMTRLKTMNSGGTWSGNTYTYNGTTFVCTATSDDYLESVTVSASNATANVLFTLMAKTDVASELSALENTAIIGSGCPADGNTSTYYLNFQGFATDGIGAPDTGSGTGTINASSFTTFNTVQIYIRVASGATFSNKVFKPQLCLASATDPTTFAPYSNICPISGWSEAHIPGSGKNLLYNPQPTVLNPTSQPNLTFTKRADGAVVVNGTASSDYSYVIWSRSDTTSTYKKVPIDGSISYTLSGCPSGVSGAVMQFQATRNGALHTYGTDTGSGATGTPQVGDVLQVTIRITGGTTLNNAVFYPQLEVGSTKTTYAPYTGNLVTIAFGSTVYGCLLRYVGGLEWEATPTHEIIDLGTLTWGYDSGQRFWTDGLVTLAKRPPSNYDAANLLCSIYKSMGIWDASYATSDAVMGLASDNGRFLTRDSRYTDAASYKTAMSGINLVYELATPLAPITLTADKETVTQYGDNVLFADCGDSAVTYRQDIGLLLSE